MGKKLKKIIKKMSCPVLIGGILLSNPIHAQVSNNSTKIEESEKKDKKDFDFEKEIHKLSLEEGLLDNQTFLKGCKIRDYSFDLDYANIMRYKLYNNDKGLVIYVKDLHDVDRVQENIYRTLREFIEENNIDLLLLENYTQEELFGEEMNGWEAGFYGDAGVWIEYNYKDKITTLGAEYGAKELRDECKEIIKNIIEGKKEYLSDFRNKVIYERSKIIAETVVKEMKNRNEDISVLICGGGHTKSLIDSFEKNEVSYMVIEVEGYFESIFKDVNNYEKDKSPQKFVLKK